jgi:putative flippase GtrA
MIVHFSKYSFIATGSAVTDWLAFIVLTFIGVPPLAAQATSRITGGLFSFFCNRHWIFKASKISSIAVQGRRFLLLYIVSYGLSLGIFYFAAGILEINIFVAKAVADTTCFIFNFVVMWLYVFHKRTGFIYWVKAKF